jgi:nitronate monooxygenase
MPIRTRLTERLGIRLPILNAPMGLHAGGRLAAAVTQAGGLGLIGALGPHDGWIEEQFAAAGNTRVGAGFITWRLADKLALLDQVLAHAPAALMLSFGDPLPFIPAIKRSGTLLICQVQTLHHARVAVDGGADIIVTQGGEAGGHGSNTRGTMTLVPEIADLLAGTSPETLLLAAGGIADGRGLAAALMLGADGVLVGSRFWTATESLAEPEVKHAALAADGDGTVRTHVGDIARGFPWPAEFTSRVLRNAFTARWHGREDALRAQADAQLPAYRAAIAALDLSQMTVNVGEVVGLMDREQPVAEIIAAMAAQAEGLLSSRWGS